MPRTLIQVNSVVKRYGLQTVLNGADLTLNEKQKIGVIGRNGAGKTTLFRMMIGTEEPDEGSIVRYPQLRLGVIEQQLSFTENESALEYLLRASNRPSWQCAKIASRFQLTEQDLSRPTSELSGGYQMRLKLSALLLAEPNFLLLDEPTNFLDLSTQLLFERFLLSYRGGFFIISHDREFLKRTCDSTLEVDQGKCFFFPRDIESYLAFKESERERQENENKKVEAKAKHLQRFVDRFRYKASLASQAQSKLKQIARLRTIELTHPAKTARIFIPSGKIKKGLALRAEGLTIGYGSTVVAKNISFEVYRGSHVAILGNNGEGKSTLLKTLAGELNKLEGSFEWGQDLTPGYYAQHVYQTLDERERVGKYLERSAEINVTTEEILRLAGNFLFRGDELDKTISSLSGGERARLTLAGLLLSKKPLFLFDEPTNHLDFETVEALGQALKEYPGTIFFVSHNRTFVSLVATTVFELSHGKLSAYNGRYEDYVADLHDRLDRELPPDISPNQKRAMAPLATKPKEDLLETKTKIKAAQRRQQNVMKEIEQLQNERELILAEMAINPTIYSKVKNERLAVLERSITEKEDAWLGIEREIDWLSAT